MQSQSTTLLIIGGGPGGYVAAIRAGQLGVPTILVEAAEVGGTCLNIGCIPSKALIHAAEQFHALASYDGSSPLGIQVQSPRLELARTIEWKDGIVHRLTTGVTALLKKNGVSVIHGHAQIVDGKTVDITPNAASAETIRVNCEHLLLATGSQAVELPGMPFGEKIVSSTEALSPSTLPKQLVVIGAGYIGLELGTAYRKLGCEVHVVEAQDRILPTYDAELTKPVLAALKKLGMQLHLSCSVRGLDEDQNLRLQNSDGTVISLPADRILIAIGRRPRTTGYRLESLMLDMAGRAVQIDDQCRTSMRNVWAIGDAAAVPDLALDASKPTPPTAQHAQRQGVQVAKNVAASLGVGESKPYFHKDLGLVADLGGFDGVAKPLGIPLKGPVAKFVARSYHLYALPTAAARVRVATDWLYSTILPTRVVNLDQVRAEDALIAKAQGQ